MSDGQIEEVNEKDIHTILAKDINFTGELNFQKPLMIKGHFEGEIKAEGDLYISEEAVVEARVEASLVSVRGKVKGDIIGHKKVELAQSAEVEGDITAPEIIMERGCHFNGKCNMSKI